MKYMKYAQRTKRWGGGVHASTGAASTMRRDHHLLARLLAWSVLAFSAAPLAAATATQRGGCLTLVGANSTEVNGDYTYDAGMNKGDKKGGGMLDEGVLQDGWS